MSWFGLFMVFLVLAAVAYFILQAGDQPTKICKACGHIGGGKLKTRGSIGIEIILWLCFIVPGLIYSLWRHGSRYRGCELCGSSDLIPVNSPYGQQMLAAREEAERAPTPS